jgi:hypothetical protein
MAYSMYLLYSDGLIQLFVCMQRVAGGKALTGSDDINAAGVPAFALSKQ